MKRRSKIIFTFLTAAVFMTCNRVEKSKEKVPLEPQNLSTTPIDIEEEENNSGTTFIIFDDPSYLVAFKMLSPKEEHIATLTLTHNHNDQTEILLKDTLRELYDASVELKDFNNDNVKDILILFEANARGNWTGNLYLANPVKHNLNPVKNFDDVYNPDFDSLNNIITSVALTGPTYYYSFYRIDEKGNLINLGNAFEGVPTTDKDEGARNGKYDSAINNILKQGK